MLMAMSGSSPGAITVSLEVLGNTKKIIYVDFVYQSDILPADKINFDIGKV